MIKRGLHVLIFCLCAFHLAVGDGFKLVYSSESPNKIKLQVLYDNFRIEAYKFSYDGKFIQIPFNNTQPTHIWIDQLVPCTLYHVEAKVRDLQSNSIFDYNESILLIPPKTVLQTLSYSNAIDIEINFKYRQCFDSVSVDVDNSLAVSYTQENLSSWLTISDLSPCVTYNVAIYIPHRPVQLIIYNQTITTISINYKEVQNINYEVSIETLRWPNFLGDCSLKYLIIATSNNSSAIITRESAVNEYRLDFLDGCSEYNITVTSKNHSVSSINRLISTGRKDPGPITNLKVNMIDNRIWCRWNPPIENPACFTAYKVQINNDPFITKAHEHSIIVTRPCQIYSISVCLVAGHNKFNCIDRTFDSSEFEFIQIQNISNIDIKTNYNRIVAAVSWNVSGIDKWCIKHYEVRLYENFINEIYQENVTSSMVQMPQLIACQQYRLAIKTIPKHNVLTKIESNFEFITKPMTPDAPTIPKLLSKTTRSITLETQYFNDHDICTIELFKISCVSYDNEIKRILYDEGKLTTINNLRSGIRYYCSATVKNEVSWSPSSKTTSVFLEGQYRTINLYVNSISPTSITISCQISDKNVYSTLVIEKVEPRETFPKNCEFTNYSKTVGLYSEHRKINFRNLEPNTNYSFLVFSWIQDQNYSDQIFVTTDPDVPFQVTNLEILDLSSLSVTLAWRLPCELNGQVKSFVGKLYKIDLSNSTELLYDWNVPFNDENRNLERFRYTENRIKSQHKYIISVAIKLANFDGRLNESKIEFIVPEPDLEQISDWGRLIEKTSEYHELEINQFFSNHHPFTLLISEPECIRRESDAGQCVTECTFNETINKVKIILATRSTPSCGLSGQNSIEFMKGRSYRIQGRFGNITTNPLKNEHTDSLKIVIGAAIFLVVVVVSISVIYRRHSVRKRNNKMDSIYVSLSDISCFLNSVDNCDFIRKEFQTICNIDLSHLTKTVQQNQESKNRNLNIIPYDFNQVVLELNQFCCTKYINASYIVGHNNEKQYIATEEPSNATVYNFWHMVIQEKCNKIVMLEDQFENGCVKYYPKLNNNTLEFDDLIVKNVGVTNFGNFIKRVLKIIRNNITHHVVHYQFTKWSDNRSSNFPLNLIEFIELTGSLKKQSPNPFLVHSLVSTRTGTYIALDILLQKSRIANEISICNVVKELRAQRCGMVESFPQYEFIYATVKTYYLTRVYRPNQWM